MNEQWVRTALSPHITGDAIVLTRWPDGGIQQTVDISTFAVLFTAVSAPDYVSLSAEDTAKGYGYQPYLGQWHAEGLI